jgi:hypothetical protein
LEILKKADVIILNGPMEKNQNSSKDHIQIKSKIVSQIRRYEKLNFLELEKLGWVYQYSS